MSTPQAQVLVTTVLEMALVWLCAILVRKAYGPTDTGAHRSDTVDEQAGSSVMAPSRARPHQIVWRYLWRGALLGAGVAACCGAVAASLIALVSVALWPGENWRTVTFSIPIGMLLSVIQLAIWFRRERLVRQARILAVAALIGGFIGAGPIGLTIAFASVVGIIWGLPVGFIVGAICGLAAGIVTASTFHGSRHDIVRRQYRTRLRIAVAVSSLATGPLLATAVVLEGRTTLNVPEWFSVSAIAITSVMASVIAVQLDDILINWHDAA
jgi:hypothetical protein